MVNNDCNNDKALLESTDPSTLHGLCKTHSLPSHGMKAEMLARLWGYAKEHTKEDQLRRGGRARLVESNLKGKAWHAIIADDNGSLFGSFIDDDDDKEEMQGYFYYAVATAETTAGGGERGGAPASLSSPPASASMGGRRRSSPSSIRAPVPPDNVAPITDSERIMTI
jgi:hypothetical protein